MSVLSQTIANLYNGVSQQPPALRSPTQGTAQLNADSSLVNGVRKRRPTRHIAQISNFTFTNLHAHLIESGPDRFLAIIKDGTVEVWNADTGAQATVNLSASAIAFATERIAYFSSPSPRDNFKCLTIGDRTYVLNRGITVGSLSVTAGNFFGTTLAGTVQTFGNLPPTPTAGQTYRVVGAASDGFSGYYVVFSNDAWRETFWYPTAGTEHNPRTLPWALDRTGPNTFTLTVGDWINRICGDPTSVPPPSYIGRRVQDLFLYRNRLGMITDTSVLLSEAGNLTNFYATTATTVRDDDPIDALVQHPKIVNLQHAVPYNSEVIIFGDRVQFQLSGGDVLSPRTARVDAITEFECSQVAKPVGIGPNLYFVQTGQNQTRIREMFIRPDTAQNDAEDVTAHVPDYIPTGVFDLATSSIENTLFALSASTPTDLYVYKTQWQGDKRIQSSWSTWRFGSQFQDGTAVLGLAATNSFVYLVISRSVGLSIERIDLTDRLFEVTDGDSQRWLIHLDQRSGFLSGVYDAVNDRTEWTLPYSVNTNVPLEVVVFGGGINAGSGQRIANTSRPNTNSVRAPGNWSSQLCIAGRPYTMRYTMSPLFVRNGDGVPDIVNRLQVRKLDVLFRDTGYLRVEVTPARRETLSRVFNPQRIGLLSTGFSSVETGRMSAAVMSRGDTVRIDFVNDTPYPSGIIAVEWTGIYDPRNRRL
jgi:hypothetical protein